MDANIPQIDHTIPYRLFETAPISSQELPSQPVHQLPAPDAYLKSIPTAKEVGKLKDLPMTAAGELVKNSDWGDSLKCA